MFRRTFIKKRRPVKKNCPFCKEKKEPDYKEVEILRKYISDRGRILGKDITGLCAKHQRRVTKEIKRARYLAMLPFVEGL